MDEEYNVRGIIIACAHIGSVVDCDDKNKKRPILHRLCSDTKYYRDYLNELKVAVAFSGEVLVAATGRTPVTHYGYTLWIVDIHNTLSTPFILSTVIWHNYEHLKLCSYIHIHK